MRKSRLYGAGGLALAFVAFLFREAIAGIVGDFATKVIHPDLLDRWGGAVTFTLADFIILALLLGGVFLLAFPWIERRLRPEIERQQIRTAATGRSVFADLAFQDESEAMAINKAFKPIFVDCTFKLGRMAVAHSLFDDGFRVECAKITLCDEAQIEEASRAMPALRGARLISSPIYCEHLFITHAMAADIMKGQALKGEIPFDAALVQPLPSPLRRLLTRISNARP